MENLFMFLATSLVLRISSPKFKRYFIGNTGASALLFSANKSFVVKLTAEGDRIYFNNHTEGGVSYGLIFIDMRRLYAMKQAENILMAYIDKIKAPLKIAHNVQIELKRKHAVISATDYWQDADGTDWKVAGYTNGKLMAVLYVKNISDSFVKQHDAYLNGFKFS